MATLNQTELMQALEDAVAGDSMEFIFTFLHAYKVPKATITQVRNVGARNLAPAGSGDIAIKNTVYFHAADRPGEDVHEAAGRMRDDPLVGQHQLRFVIVTDFQELVAYDTKVNDRMECDFSDLPRYYSFFLPMAGFEKAQTHNEAAADVKAAEKMGRLCDLIRRENTLETREQTHALNVFLSRLLFCLYAEDTGIFEPQQFTDALRQHTQGSDTAEFFSNLFRVLNKPNRDGSEPVHLEGFPYVNGGLFRDEIQVPRLGQRSRRMIIDAGSLDWSEINPDIFGSMFQSVIDPEQRGNLGQHYTSPSNIMKVLRPLFIDKLEADLESAKGSRKKLEAFLERLQRIVVADMACGSGNFLILAYKELRRLEMEAFRALDAVTSQQTIFMSGIRLTQFYGVEIDDFAHETALLSLWLAEHQMNKAFREEFGDAPPTLPLKSGANIELGNALRMDWERFLPSAPDNEIYICGNPPFLGATWRSDQQNADMDCIFLGQLPRHRYLDYVAAFFWKAADLTSKWDVEVGLVATNSICQGEQTGMLWPGLLRKGAVIHFAYQTFSWSNSAKGTAGVHVVIIGLSSECGRKRRLFKKGPDGWRVQEVDNISPYLVAGAPTTVSSRRKPFRGARPMTRGNQPTDGGFLILTPQEKRSLIEAEPKSEAWIKRLLGADEYLNGKERWCLWLVGASWEQIESMPQVKDRIEKVRQYRLDSRKKATREKAKTPHLFDENRHPEKGQYILVPRVTSERRQYAPVGFFGSDVISTDLNQMIPNGTYYEFALLMSSMHMAWLRLVGGRLKSDYRYSAKLVYNTFPWPDAGPRQKETIEKLADNILMIREDYFDWTMAQMYDPDKMPAPLLEAHRELDRAVEKLYRDRPFRDQAERQEYLLAQYEKLLAEEQTQG